MKTMEFLGIGVALLAAAIIAVGVSPEAVGQNNTSENDSRIGISTNLSGAQSSLSALNNTGNVEYSENETGS